MLNQKLINIGEYVIADKAMKLVCSGLGSCVGLFLFDKRQNIGAGAHIFLPKTEGQEVSLLDQLFYELEQKRINLFGLKAKIVGGANVLTNDCYSLGKRNADYTLCYLKRKGIFRLTKDIGGDESRYAAFNTQDGSLFIRSKSQKIFI